MFNKIEKIIKWKQNFDDYLYMLNLNNLKLKSLNQIASF
jgi:hypothetical protein